MPRSVAPVPVETFSRERQSCRRVIGSSLCVVGLAAIGCGSDVRAETLLRPTLQLQTDAHERAPATHDLRIPTVRDAGGRQVVPQAIIQRLAPNARWTTEAFPAPRAPQPVHKPALDPAKTQPALVKPVAAPPKPAEPVKPAAAILPPRKPLLKPVTRTVVPTSHTPATTLAPAPAKAPVPVTKPAEPQVQPTVAPAAVQVVRLQPLAKPPAPSILAEPEPQPLPKPQLVAAFSPVFVPVRTDALTGKEPAPAEAQCLPASLKKVLAEASRRFGTIWVTSAHRSVERNRLVGGRPRSFHLECRAVDFRPERNPLGLMAFLRGRPEVGGLKRYPNGLFHIDDGPRRTW